MALASGTYALGPDEGMLELRTYREGAAAMAGHDLVFQASRWSGTLTVDADDPGNSSVEASVELAGLEVREGHGGVKPLTDKDRVDIAKTMNDRILGAAEHPSITFRSDSVTAAGDRGTVHGTLTVAGRSEPLDVGFRVHDEDEGPRVAGDATVVQTNWGIKPYRGFFGALRLRDAVDVSFELRPRAAG